MINYVGDKQIILYGLNASLRKDSYLDKMTIFFGYNQEIKLI